jgi:hypothetical protein
MAAWAGTNRPLAKMKNSAALSKMCHSGSGPEVAMCQTMKHAHVTSTTKARKRPCRSASFPTYGPVKIVTTPPTR